MKLKNRSALITGASRGIGREIALALAREGASVAVTGRTVELLNSLQSEIEATGVGCAVVAADLTDRSAPAKIWQETENALGRVDILVNNAGIGSSADPRPVALFVMQGGLAGHARAAVRADHQCCFDQRPGGLNSRRGVRGQQTWPAGADALTGHRNGPAGHHRKRHLPWSGADPDEQQTDRLRC